MKNIKIIAVIYFILSIFIGIIGFVMSMSLSSHNVKFIDEIMPLYGVGKVDIDSKKNIYVHGKQFSIIQVYSPNGTFLKRINIPSKSEYYLDEKDNIHVFSISDRKEIIIKSEDDIEYISYSEEEFFHNINQMNDIFNANLRLKWWNKVVFPDGRVVVLDSVNTPMPYFIYWMISFSGVFFLLFSFRKNIVKINKSI